MNGRPIEALMVDSETSWRGGEGQLRLLMTGLCEQGVRVTLAADARSEIRRRTTHLPIAFAPLTIKGGMDLAAAWQLRSIVRRGRFDIVHSHASHAHSVTFLACATMRGRPLQVVSRRVDFDVASNALSGLKYRYGADVYLAISSGVRDALVRSGIRPERIRMVPSGIDLAKFDGVKAPGYLRDEFAIADGTLVVGNIAALAPHKSQDDLIRAAEIVCRKRSDVRFFIVGEGELDRDLKGLVASLGLQAHVTFTGFREDVLELLGLFDCFVMSSHLEGLGTSIMDAQAAGIPVVATRTGGIVDVVEDGETGLLVSPRRPDELASAIARMLDDKSLQNKCITNASRRSLEYDYRHMVYKTVDAYRGLLSKQRTTTSP